ncbi:MAG: hypothetical protein GWO24_13780 [Akkermansiaceae bacterium]|nr:hypothetical protein [Akkermansiaceae bacterium]
MAFTLGHGSSQRMGTSGDAVWDRVLTERANRVVRRYRDIDFEALSLDWNAWVKARNEGVMDIKLARRITGHGRRVQKLAKAFKTLEKTPGWPKEK